MHLGLYYICSVTIVSAFSVLKSRGFDPALQHVDVTGAHRFIAPAASDLRGPCPAMNAAANHGYIARNGYTTLQESLDASPDIAFFLATLVDVQTGDGNHFSIGGPPDKSLPVVGGLLGQPRGMSNSHNRFEGDASPARGDLYQFGEAYLTKMPIFQGLYDLPGNVAIPTTTSICSANIPLFAVHKESVAQNPYFFRGFISFLLPPGTHAFIARMFANHSADYPDGFLGRDTLKSFYAMSGPDNELVYSPGNERIPENWYRRAADNLYTAPFFDSDLYNIFGKHPELVAFGGNTGTVNSFAGLNIADLTGGAYNAETLLQGNNLACFLFQSVAVAAPDLIRQTGVIADVLSAVNKINSAVAQATGGLGCPQLNRYDYDSSQLSKYPGYTKLTKQGTY
ncbi:hypothetical protein MMC07_001427 [Pseudocyphellaria aurata]|nr:hypothetical protein [Pseudocyphellaria aurata]